MHGQGVYFYANGSKYTGELKLDKIGGNGRIDLKSGE
jgi:hypothetical protein